MSQTVTPSGACWPDADGTSVRVGDYITVWCPWTQQPKFEGRAVRVTQVLEARGQLVLRVEDPQWQDSPQYLVAEGAAFRRVEVPASASTEPRHSGLRLRPDAPSPWAKAGADNDQS